MSTGITNAVNSFVKAGDQVGFHGGFNAGQNKFSLPPKAAPAEPPAQATMFRAPSNPTFSAPPSLNNARIGNAPLVGRGTAHEGTGDQADVKPYAGVTVHDDGIGNDRPFANGAFGYTTPRGIVTGDNNSAAFTPYRNGMHSGGPRPIGGSLLYQPPRSLAEAVNQMFMRDLETAQQNPAAVHAGMRGAQALRENITQNGIPDAASQAVLRFAEPGASEADRRVGALAAAINLGGRQGTSILNMDQNPTVMAIAIPSTAFQGREAFVEGADKNLKAARIDNALAQTQVAQAKEKVGQLMEVFNSASRSAGGAVQRYREAMHTHGPNAPETHDARNAARIAIDTARSIKPHVMAAMGEVHQAEFGALAAAKRLQSAQIMVNFANSLQGDQLSDGEKAIAGKIQAFGYDLNNDGVLGPAALQKMILDHDGDKTGNFDLVTGQTPPPLAPGDLDGVIPHPEAWLDRWRQGPGIRMDAPLNKDQATG